MTVNEAKFKFILRLGDNALMQGQRLSEWCSRGPILEEDIALSNLSLDYLGRARAFYQYATVIENNNRTEDDLAYKRDERHYYNHLINELPNGDFAFTIVKQLFTSTFDHLVFLRLKESSDETLAALAMKMDKEARYHISHARDWFIRLALGTDESKTRLQNAINDIWMYAGELFEMNEQDYILVKEKIGVDFDSLKTEWQQMILNLCKNSSIEIPLVTYVQTGGNNGIHTEHLGHLLSELQYLQRAYPTATW